MEIPYEKRPYKVMVLASPMHMASFVPPHRGANAADRNICMCVYIYT